MLGIADCACCVENTWKMLQRITDDSEAKVSAGRSFELVDTATKDFKDTDLVTDMCRKDGEKRNWFSMNGIGN